MVSTCFSCLWIYCSFHYKSIFNEKNLKNQCHLQQEQMQALSFKPCCDGRCLWGHQGKEEQGLCLVQDWLCHLGKKGESPSGGLDPGKGRAGNWGAVPHLRCSEPHWNTSAGGISWVLLPFQIAWLTFSLWDNDLSFQHGTQGNNLLSLN